MPTVTMRYWAAAREAAGTQEESCEAATLAEALAAVRARRSGDDRFGRVLARSSFLVDSDPVGRRDPAGVALAEGATVEVLPPFAGG
ncbi:MoaD/ThiS family protein [Allonocardiopsis opalescens]|uniref:Molybdopterin converting factor small subunit n=1 Tax=Allonocardiopsis opalescens TaxID=1144618 RepID=A0A2T0QAE1_9ACTN|nr:MoaD/ThiS family protein [Allonocardiopsis opalescens]PRY00781.1 molybdopterin converting factor small subunit [Allonocardiopsis opalescens]